MSLLISFFEIFLAVCGFILLWRSLRGKKSKKRRIKNWPVVGMLPEIILNINRVHDGFTELHDRCGGTFLFKVPWFEMLTTTDPANIQHIMTTSFSNYPKGPEFKKIFDVVGNGFSNADDDLWRNHRRVAQQLLTHNKFYQFLLKTTYDKVQNGLIPLLDHVSKQGLVVDLQDVFIRLTFDATCILVTGHDPGSLSVGFPDAPFPRALIDAEEAIFYRHAMPEKTWKLMRFLGIGKEKKLAKAVETLDNLICKCISTKRQENNGESTIDLLTSYMDQDNTQGWEIDDKLLRDTILNLMIAGQDTTASALTWFFWLLSENPSVETKIREELETTEPESDIENLNKLVYLHAALCESLRLYPPVPFQLKTPLKADILPSGHKVEPNTKVMLLTYSMGRMKRVWGKDCLDYKPERWISENGRIKYEPSSKFFAFNAGPRTCLGKQVAFTQLKTTAAAIITNFDVEVIVGRCVAPSASIILHMKHGLKVRVTKRGYC